MGWSLMSYPCYLSVDARTLGACEQAVSAGLPGGCSDPPTREAAGCSPATWAERRLRPSSYEDASRAMREPRYRWEMWGAVFCLGICHRHHVSSVAGRHNTGQISSLRLQVHRRRHPVQFPTYGLSEDHLIHSHLLKALVRSQYSNLWPVVDSHHDLTPARWLVW